jgi:hypothetical protein
MHRVLTLDLMTKQKISALYFSVEGGELFVHVEHTAQLEAERFVGD